VAQIVPTPLVIYSSDIPSEYSIRKMENEQGQIEPLQVKQVGDAYLTFPQDAHAADIVVAARRLDWPTLLVAVCDRYEY
jgi:hypothetical protein